MFAHWHGKNVGLAPGTYTVGSPYFSSGVKKFGTHSLAIDGVIGYEGMYWVPDDSINLGTHWTIEGWFYAVDPGLGNYGSFSALTFNTDELEIFGITGNLNSLGMDVSWRVSATSTTAIVFGADYNVWHHIALVRNGNQWLTYLDGTQTNELADTSWANGTLNQVVVGFEWDTTRLDQGTTGSFNGYIDEIRISDTARYTSTTSITVPTAPFTNDANTVFLRHLDNSYT